MTGVWCSWRADTSSSLFDDTYGNDVEIEMGKDWGLVGDGRCCIAFLQP